MAILILAGCVIRLSSSKINKKTFHEWNNHQQSVSRLTSYKTRGAFFYFSEAKKIYARFILQKINANYYHLVLTNLLSSIEMNLDVKTNIIHVINNQGKHYISENPEMMIQKLFKITIPLRNLQKWILGLPGDTEDFTIDINGYLRKLNYNENGQRWTIIYHSYHSDITPALPSNIELRLSDSYIKLKIDNWNIL